jgi:hypothetical protein
LRAQRKVSRIHAGIAAVLAIYIEENNSAAASGK